MRVLPWWLHPFSRKGTYKLSGYLPGCLEIVRLLSWHLWVSTTDASSTWLASLKIVDWLLSNDSGSYSKPIIPGFYRVTHGDFRACGCQISWRLHSIDSAQLCLMLWHDSAWDRADGSNPLLHAVLEQAMHAQPHLTHSPCCHADSPLVTQRDPAGTSLGGIHNQYTSAPASSPMRPFSNHP